MTIKQEITKIFTANPSLSKESPLLYHTYYKVADYEYDNLQNKHKLAVVSTLPDQITYKLERTGDLHPDLINCLKEKEEIVYFWTGEKLDSSDLFFFEGHGYYWAIFPKKDFIEKQNAQEYLNKYYPKEKRSEVETLNIPGIKTKTIGWQLLEGHCDLSGFTNLKELNCSDNQLTSLNLNNCQQLEKLDCSNNLLTDSKTLFSSLNPEKLKELNLSNNKFPPSKLTSFSKFVNLESLDISNNFFTESLEPLKNLTNLMYLDIHNTNIDNGLEHLPKSLETFKCYDERDEKLGTKSTELYQKELHAFNGDLKTWTEFFNSPAQKWLDQEYYEEHQEEEENFGIDLLLENEDKVKKRKDIIELDISRKNLEGVLRLKGFADLKKLNFSNNQLTKLNLSDCPNLVELYISNNEFDDLEFLKSVPKLEIFSVTNNQKLTPQDLRILLPLNNLKELDISNCPFQGSLKVSENFKQLKRLNISNTDISEGLEYLTENCKCLYCNSDYQYKSTKIMEELDKSRCWEENHKYYDLDKWRTDKANGLTTSVIPSERLFVIRSNIKQFLKKWGKEYEKSWYERIFSKGESKSTELSQLQNPNEINTYWYLGESGQWIARGTAVTGGILATTVNPVLGGILATVSPVVEVGASQMKEKVYETKEKKWSEFLTDADNFLDSFHELVGILKQIKVSQLGAINESFKNLQEKVYRFLNQHDEDGNEEIDINELINERGKFNEELGKLEEIVNSIKDLENKVIDYKQGKLIEEKEKQNFVDNELLEQIELKLNWQAIDKELERKTKQNLSQPGITIQKIIPGGKLKQFLIISKVEPSLLTFFNFWNSIWGKEKASLSRPYHLRWVEEKKGEAKILQGKIVNKWFGSEEEAAEKAKRIQIEEILNEIKRKELEERTSKEREKIISQKERLINEIITKLEERKQEIYRIPSSSKNFEQELGLQANIEIPPHGISSSNQK